MQKTFKVMCVHHKSGLPNFQENLGVMFSGSKQDLAAYVTVEPNETTTERGHLSLSKIGHETLHQLVLVTYIFFVEEPTVPSI